MSARKPKEKTEKGPEPRVEEPRVKVSGMLPFDEAAEALGLSKKALGECIAAGVVAAARIGDDTYVMTSSVPALGMESIGGLIAANLMELVSATERIAATLGGLAPHEFAPEAPGAPPPPTGTYGEQVDAQAERAIAQIEGAEGDWGLFSQFLQPEWKPLPDVLFNHLQVASAVEIEEYDVTLAIPSRAISVLRAVKAKFGARAEAQRQAEDWGEYQTAGCSAAGTGSDPYASMPITPLMPSEPLTPSQQRVHASHISAVLPPFGRPPLDERVEEFLPACVKWERAWEDVHTGLVHKIGDDANYQFRVRDASLRVAEKAMALVKRLDEDIPQEPALPTGSIREQKELQQAG